VGGSPTTPPPDAPGPAPDAPRATTADAAPTSADPIAPDGAADRRGADAVAPPAGNGSCKRALVCDDFEANAAGSVPMGWGRNGSTVGVDDKRGLSGTHSVHVNKVGQGNAFITRRLPALPDNAFFGRMMIWLDKAPSNVGHWDSIRASPASGGSPWSNYGGFGTQLGANYYSGGSDCWSKSATRIPVGRWACVEFQYDGSKNLMRYWLDGQPVTDLSIDGKGQGCSGPNLWKAPTYGLLSLGWYNAQGGSAEMWIDDVAVDTKQIGCPAAK